jgi:predicted nuclease with TOPRIM domain
MTELRRELLKLSQSNENLSSRYEEANNLLQILEREKELADFDKNSLIREVEILKTRLMEMQEVERALVL